MKKTYGIYEASEIEVKDHETGSKYNYPSEVFQGDYDTMEQAEQAIQDEFDDGNRNEWSIKPIYKHE